VDSSDCAKAAEIVIDIPIGGRRRLLQTTQPAIVVWMYVCMCVSMYVYVCAYICVCVCIYVCVCVCVCVTELQIP